MSLWGFSVSHFQQDLKNKRKEKESGIFTKAEKQLCVHMNTFNI